MLTPSLHNLSLPRRVPKSDPTLVFLPWLEDWRRRCRQASHCLPAWRDGTSGLLSLPVELKQETDHYIVSQPGVVVLPVCSHFRWNWNRKQIIILFPSLAEWTSGLRSLPEELKQETDHYIVSQPGRVDFRSALTSGGAETGNRSLYCFPIWPSGLPVYSIFLWDWNRK